MMWDDVDPAILELPSSFNLLETIGLLAVFALIIYLGLVISMYLDEKNKKL